MYTYGVIVADDPFYELVSLRSEQGYIRANSSYVQPYSYSS